MAKLRQKPITFESDTRVSLNQGRIKVSGPKGDMEIELPSVVKAQVAQNEVTLAAASVKDNPMVGLYNSLIRNAITGVKSGWQKTLELVGVGFRAQVDGGNLTLNVGFSHQVKINAPQGISFEVKDNKITVSGINKYEVGEVAANVRRVKPPEPYKGKGIRYLNEVVRKKLGKAAKAIGGAPGAK
ncbi:MAG: 50S ribosomal protein L6, large subunit ribosomal protein L6 [Candidatus Gottesmanbacteria bacterium GW2011_GWA2_43_14]|uniref:50S ribosomal protein L6 n=1 Tax=Candidatus Gottesmanbacteria bacterium GW2011_GWA2_43_14 TaxID=1618443 RepID=A0A0G1DDQ2_9BACT|nr:MAG: 50S ribosomal protein L6, large subunit ribosomal protein L6 [Candidatus Gottesmanbacteria bacterium GW2011_GWA2_43_14]